MDNEALLNLLAQYEAPVVLLKALRAAASEALDAYGTDEYNQHLETVFDVTAELMAAENYTDEMEEAVFGGYNLTDEPLFETDEPVSMLPDVLADNVIPFRRPA